MIFPHMQSHAVKTGQHGHAQKIWVTPREPRPCSGLEWAKTSALSTVSQNQATESLEPFRPELDVAQHHSIFRRTRRTRNHTNATTGRVIKAPSMPSLIPLGLANG